ncbi:uncharacterized protein [Centruroides vittatus]|uniref:uncharacterized protein isoform X2 n=1 Tax=Centruroides vittatus TaxID=120091 RepID=UPI003510A763
MDSGEFFIFIHLMTFHHLILLCYSKIRTIIFRNFRMEENSKVYFLEDFLIPSLDKGSFKNKLKWKNRSIGIFQIYWPDNRKHNNDDSADCCLEVYLAWLRMKRSGNQIKCKDIFRSALYSKEKDGELKRCDDEGNYRVYQFTEDVKKYKTALICQNTPTSNSKDDVINFLHLIPFEALLDSYLNEEFKSDKFEDLELEINSSEFSEMFLYKKELGNF